MTMLDDWKRYCDDPTRFDKSHFERLFFEPEVQADPSLVLWHFKGYEDSVRRLKRLFEHTSDSGFYQLPQDVGDEDRLIELVRLQGAQFVTYLNKAGFADEAVEISVDNITVTDDPEVYRMAAIDRTRRRGEGMSIISDDFADKMFEQDERLSAIYEGFWYLTTNRNVTHYLFGDMIPFAIDYEPGFSLYLNGGEALFFAGETLLLRPNGAP